MLHVFHVDTGTFITFDIKVILQSTVLELKESIQRECNVAIEDQILLISGGDVLQNSNRVGSYTAGTDTNPIFLFSMACIKSDNPPVPSLDYGSDMDPHSLVEASLRQPASYATLTNRASLASHCCHLAKEALRICELLVLDQHMMQQGWQAVIANHGDITQNLKNVAANFETSFDDYLKEREQYKELLSGFRTDLEILEKIPILPALQAQALGISSPDDEDQSKLCNDNVNDNAKAIELIQESSPETTEALNLLKWISAKDQTSLLQMFESCERGIREFDERILDSLKREIDNTMAAATNPSVREISGIGERLFGLEKLINDAKNTVREQAELSHSFQLNKSRVTNLNDTSVLPDLCESHKTQLQKMIENHNKLRDIRKRCAKAKTEFATNLHHRLKYIESSQSKMTETLHKITMGHDNMRRLRRQFDILKQIHCAPEMYVSAITEVVRRRTFSKAFLNWAGNLACQLVTVHNEEIERRRDFQNKFNGHFLNVLFPGLEDKPPAFATQAPPVFDNVLPKLTQEDMESLRQRLPNLAESITSPDLSSITQFFYSKAFTESSSDTNQEKEKVLDDISQKDRPRPPLLCDRGDLSETDTEEFEKIGQTADSKQSSFDSAKQQFQSGHLKQLEENLSNSREEVERLRAIIRSLKNIATEAMSCLREELTNLKDQSVIDKECMIKRVEEVNEAMKVHICSLREREQELTVDHELELSDLKKLLETKTEELSSLKKQIIDKEAQEIEQERLIVTMRQKLENEQKELKNIHAIYRNQLEQAHIERENSLSTLKEFNEAKLLETNQLRSSLEKREENIRELEAKLADAQTEHQKKLKDESEKHKTQMEAIVSRFRLMAASSMERSPSDSSLEKIERLDVIELVNHETILAQTKKDLEIEKEEAIRLAIQEERETVNRDLQVANEIISKHEQELDVYKKQELFLLKQQSLIQNLEMDKLKLEETIAGLIEKETKLERELESERNSRMSIEVQELSRSLEDSSVSETKKVRLETSSDLKSAKIDLLEADNRKLKDELRALRDNKERIESKVESLENEKARLQLELVKERSKLSDSLLESMSSSIIEANKEKDMSLSTVSVLSESSTRVDASTSPDRSRSRQSRETSTTSLNRKIPRSTTTILQSKISFTTCSTGDIVLITWDIAHNNFSITQESAIFYFLNSDCLADLNIQIGPNGLPNKVCFIAEVVEKEYCSARKPENRYRVPQGTKFYRVKVKPTPQAFAPLQSLLTSIAE